MAVPDLVLDPQLRIWVLFPIMVVMLLFGFLRHYATVLITSKPKTLEIKALREQQWLLKEGKYLKNPEAAANQPPNLSDPANMEGMMGMVKQQALNFVPQTLMMSWVNAMFSGFVLMKLPFPLTIRFKQMLQSGVATNDLDVRWVSAVSWYVLNLFGLRAVYSLLLGENNTAIPSNDQPPMPNLGAPGVDARKVHVAEAESLLLSVPQSLLNGVESRMLNKYSNL